MVKLGIQFWPWTPFDELLLHCEQAQRSGFDQVWLVDSLEYEDPFTVLAVLAERYDLSLGTMVTFPRRDPFQLAQRFASMAKLMHPGRELSLGLGAGGVIHALLPPKSPAPLAVVEETLKALTALLRGDTIQIADFPGLVSSFGYNPVASFKLFFPPPVRVPVYFAASKPKMQQTGAQLADGLIMSQLSVKTSLYGMRTGLFKDIVTRIGSETPLIYTIKISISNDGEKARQWAKRQASYGIATRAKFIKQCGFDPAEIDRIREAYDRHLGIDEGASRVSDGLLKALGVVIAGTPAECASQLEELLSHLKSASVNLVGLVPGVPLGPDVSEAVELISRDIAPALKRWLQ